MTQKPKPKPKPDWLRSLMNQWEKKTNDKSAGKRVWTSPVTTDTDHSHDVLNQHTALLVYHEQNPFLSTRLCFLVLNVDYNATLKFNCLFSVKLLIVISFFQCRWFLSRAIFSLMFDPQLVEGKIPSPFKLSFLN